MTEDIANYTSGAGIYFVNNLYPSNNNDLSNSPGEDSQLLSTRLNSFYKLHLLIDKCYQSIKTSSFFGSLTDPVNYFNQENKYLSNNDLGIYLQRLDQTLRELSVDLSRFPERVPEFFGGIVDLFLKFSKKYKSDPPISFQFLYRCLMRLNLFEIEEKTIFKITSSLQWRIISTKWLDINFWKKYYSSISSSLPNSYKKAVQILIQAIRTVQIEEKKQSDFATEYRLIMQARLKQGNASMIYDDSVPATLEQGDICHNLPKISVDQAFSFKTDDDFSGSSFWDDFLKNRVSLADSPWQLTIIPIITSGVVLSQSCDLRPGNTILFAEIRNNPDQLSQKVRARYRQIHKILRNETRLHYLPASKHIEELSEPKIIDFKSLFQVPYDVLTKNLKEFFVARIISEARVVLQEKIARFFTRLAYDEPIFLTDDELEGWKEEEDIKNDEFEEMVSKLKQFDVRK